MISMMRNGIYREEFCGKVLHDRKEEKEKGRREAKKVGVGSY